MEVVAATPNSNGVPPFHNHDVHEWSHIDSLTGVLERARLETDHWAANTNDSSHRYGKVVDSRARTNADGVVQQRARRQLEVFQSSVPGGRLQVIKSHSVSSSRWSNKSPTVGDHKEIAQNFGDLELSLNQLDLSSQKSRATVGRSVGRRPPSRPRSRDETSLIDQQGIPLNHNAAINLHRVSRLCHQIHENAVKQTFRKFVHKPPIHERESGDGVEIVEIESTNLSDNEKPKVNGHPTLIRTKSTSSEDLHLLTPEKDKPNKSIEDLEDLEQLQNWRRTSKIRRSLQFPKQCKTPISTKPIDLPENKGSVRKIREDLETGRRLSTALRGNNVDLEALDQILQSISSSGSSDKNSINGDRYEIPEKETQIEVKKQKRNSFVTVESLQEVRGRLRRTSSPTEDIYEVKCNSKDEEIDDGIVTEDNSLNSNMPVSDNTMAQSRVRSYVYGMEAMINKKPMLGTGSLESRTSKQLNGTSNYRNEDWYNRRKSYGFEQVHNHQDPISTITKNKGVIESSTDSGICRSSEIVLVPTVNKNIAKPSKFSDYNSEFESDKFESENDSVKHNIGSVKRYTSIFEQKRETSPLPIRKPSHLGNSWQNNDEKASPRRDFEGTTITIPITSHPSSEFDRKQFDNKGEHQWNNSNGQNGEIKRHSIAVDECKYVCQPTNNNYRRTSLAINYKSDSNTQDGLDDENLQGKKQKKVEFCKTEVHFAAESGKVNIVATDEKPPPTNNFRRRRRNSGALYNQLINDLNKNGLPVLHFGDSSYEKNLLGVVDQEEDALNSNYSDTNSYYNHQSDDLVNSNAVTVSTNQTYHNYEHDIEENVENEQPKGILKNKPIKPKPYLLGDNNFFKQTSDSEENGIWGVKLKPVQNKNETPMWRSTVTLKNTLYDKHTRDASFEEKQLENETTQAEFQKLLKTLRPTKKNTSDEELYDGIRILPSQVDPRRSSWSATSTDDGQKLENKGYSTKVNIGDGEAIVIEDHGREEKVTHPTWPRHDDNLKGSNSSYFDNNIYDNSRTSNTTKWDNQIKQISLINNKTPYSPVVLRKTFNDTKKQQLKTGSKLSSPFLVGQNVPKSDHELEKPRRTTELSSSLRRKKDHHFEEKQISKIQDRHTPTPTKDYTHKLKEKRSPSPSKQHLSPFHSAASKDKRSPSPYKETYSQSSPDRQKSPSRSVLRNPRKSEMAYFGIKMSPSPKAIRKSLDNKPDLLQHYNTRDHVKHRKETRTETKYQREKRTTERPESPIYENIDDIKKSNNKTVKREFDSSILDELTKAADQILQAVNGYAEDVHKHNSSEKTKKLHKTEKLDTISETKSWKQGSSSKHKSTSHKNEYAKPKLKHTSSTSSVESVSEHRKSSTPIKRSTTDSEKYKKKSSSESTSSRAATKARRLQRASSREALLQSHGSSSEDLPVSVEVPVRKPRMVRKTKTSQIDLTKSSNSSRKHDEKGKSEERIPVGVLPEIRHKTAVSTIRSTAEKSQNRHRLRAEEMKKKSSSKREPTKSSSTSKTDKNRSISSKDPINHRISTANIKKCTKTEVSTRH